MKSWKVQSHHNALVTKTVNCLQIDPTKNCVSNDEKKKQFEKKKAESDRAQMLALHLANHLEDMGNEKLKTEKG